MEKLLEDVDLTQFLSNEDMEKLLEGVDLKQFISDEEMEELLEGVDLKQFISDEDMEELLRGIDLKEFLSDEDIEALLRRVDLKQFLTEEDIKELLGDTDYRYFLNAKTSVEYLITDLTRLRDVAQDPVYAAVQARTVMTSYGLADLALSDENFSGAQALRMQSLRADLYEYIAVLTILTSPVSGEYDAQEVISRANRTIGICNAILRELTQSY